MGEGPKNSEGHVSFSVDQINFLITTTQLSEKQLVSNFVVNGIIPGAGGRKRWPGTFRCTKG